MDPGVVERAQHGDREAYETLVRDSARRMFLVCQRVLHDGDQAEDATQQALVEMWRDLRGLRDPERFEAWTYRIAVRCALAEARRERRLRGTVRLLQGDGTTGDRDLAAVSERDALEVAFGRLTPEHRAAVVLRFFAGLSLEEIAEVVGVPAGTVASRLHYALLGLRRELQGDDGSVGVEKGLPA